jgi:hypothetical protein
VAVRTQSGSASTEKRTTERRFRLPAYGETLRLRADSQGLQGTVFGTPSERQVQAVVPSRRPWWQRLWASLKMLVALVVGVVFGYVTTRLIPGI